MEWLPDRIVLLMPDWTAELKKHTAEDIKKALECGLATAYAWKAGKRTPTEWQQKLFLAALNERASGSAKTPRKGKK